MDTEARVTLPIPRMRHQPPVHFPGPSPLPVLPTEADLAKAEKRLEQTQDRYRSTMRPGLKNDTQGIKRTMRRLEQSIASGRLGERDLYDAIVNFHLLKKVLEGKKNAAFGPVRAFENVLLVHRIVTRYLGFSR